MNHLFILFLFLCIKNQIFISVNTFSIISVQKKIKKVLLKVFTNDLFGVIIVIVKERSEKMLWKIFGYGNECDAIEVKANSFDEALAIARKIDKAFRAGFVVKKKEGNIC